MGKYDTAIDPRSLLQKIIFWVMLLAMVAAISYGAWRLYRWANWAWGYESMVEEKIRETVKPECLLPD